MIKKLFFMTSAACAVSFYSPAFASKTNGFGTITRVTSTESGALLFNVDLSSYSYEAKARRVTATRDAPPSCGAGQSATWAIDASTPAGQTAAMTLLWALEHGKSISVVGSGKCTIEANVETVSTLTFQDNTQEAVK